ncbi:MAG: hypothetical protein LBN39_00630 [Planctomycetaceae bacterium]|nr:hypothetical protein [Planctomycetaceae bacterium]
MLFLRNGNLSIGFDDISALLFFPAMPLFVVLLFYAGEKEQYLLRIVITAINMPLGRIRIDSDTFTVERRYKRLKETVMFNDEDIADIRRGEPAGELQPDCGFPIFGHFPPLLCNRGSRRLELVLFDGTVEYLPQLPFSTPKENGSNNRLCNVLNVFMNG